MALNTKLQTFVDVFDGDANKAADIAGISQQYGRALMMSLESPFSKPKAAEVQLAIRQRETTDSMVIKGEIANRHERQRFWTQIVRGELTDIIVGLDGKTVIGREATLIARMRASELLGKSEADFVDVIKGADSMLLVLGSPRKQVESKVLENHDGNDTSTEAGSVPSEEK